MSKRDMRMAQGTGASFYITTERKNRMKQVRLIIIVALLCLTAVQASAGAIGGPHNLVDGRL